MGCPQVINRAMLVEPTSDNNIREARVQEKKIQISWPRRKPPNQAEMRILLRGKMVQIVVRALVSSTKLSYLAKLCNSSTKFRGVST
jgi:hypothetical protein